MRRRIKYHCERFSNNNQPKFTDQEIMTVYLFSVYKEKNEVKEIHGYSMR